MKVMRIENSLTALKMSGIVLNLKHRGDEFCLPPFLLCNFAQCYIYFFLSDFQQQSDPPAGFLWLGKGFTDASKAGTFVACSDSCSVEEGPS